MHTSDPSSFLLMGIMSMAICMVIIPVMMRIAPAIGMVDAPDSRKVHTQEIPRSGGIGIVLGILIPLVIWFDISESLGTVIFGCLILLLFGAWDDARNIRPVFKFVGQFVAAVSVVYYGDIYVYHFPFYGVENIPEYLGKPFTVIAIVGMINALNLSDGLDGLAGGEALISLIAIAYLAYQFDGVTAVALASVTIGGIFGFLRFNSHPARIFMGDAGSQTLGFILAVLVVYLTQQVNPVVSPVIALSLLGLPVVDSLVVFFLRARRGDSLVTAAKDHLHHRLLALGFYHYESVIIIYSVQILLVSSAVLLPYESDLLLLSIYCFVCFIVFSLLVYAESKTWKAHVQVERNDLLTASGFLTSQVYNLRHVPYRTLDVGLSLFIIAAVIMSQEVPADLAWSSSVLLLLVLLFTFLKLFADILYRLVLYVTIGFSVYLLSTYPPAWLLDQVELVYIFFTFMTVVTFIAIRLTATDNFQITPLDYLVVIMAIIVSMAPGFEHGSSSLVWLIVQMVILFYACELVIQEMKSRFNSFSAAVVLGLVLIAYRGLA